MDVLGDRKRGTGCVRLLLLCAALSAMAGCSTTRRLPEGDILYTGVRRMDIRGMEDSTGREIEIPGYVRTAARDPLSVRPNNPLFSPYIRSPFPVGLWAWNYLYDPDGRGFRNWLYNWLAKEPVTIARVRPAIRAEMVDHNLRNVGHFGATADYEIIPQRNPRKARISYRVRIPPPIFCDSLSYLEADGVLGRVIDSLGHTALIGKGMQFNIDTFVMERNRITETLRNKGYYYFRPEYVRFQADTTWGAERRYAMRMIFDPEMPEAVKKQYRVGRVHFNLANVEPGEPDTIRLRRMLYTFDRPLKLRPRVLFRTITVRQGDLFTVAQQNITQTNLNKLGMFRFVNIGVTPLDSLRGADSLNVFIQAQMEQPLQAEFEVDFYQKSNSFVGPGAIFSVQHNNLFRGGELFTVRLTGSYEWQTGNRQQADEKTSLIDSYEFGVSASLRIPRITPFKWGSRSRYPTGTTFQLGAELLNQPAYFRMLSLNGSIGYDFQTSPYSRHSITPIKLVYNRRLQSTEAFERIVDSLPAFGRSFEDYLIPSLNYIYTFDRTYSGGKYRVFLQANLTSAGNLTSSVMQAFGHGIPQHLLGNQFAQFVKGILELKGYRRVGQSSQIASRLIVGAGFPYGNSRKTYVDEDTGEVQTSIVLPYAEQFFIGGANSIRAFTVRTLGPGSWLPPVGTNGSVSQTGEFKLEANVEFRFRIWGGLNGAVFLDAGNIWLLRPDPSRPEATLTARRFFNDVALGTGAGLRYDLSVLVLRLDMGIALHTPYDNPNRGGYYNISTFRDGLGFHLAIGYPF